MKRFIPNQAYYMSVASSPAGVYALARAPKAWLMMALAITAKQESNYTMDAKSSRGALGLYQFLPSTINNFYAKYGPKGSGDLRDLLPPWSDDPVVQGKYAILHLLESYRTWLQKGWPNVGKRSSSWGDQGVAWIATRFYYYNGPSRNPKFPKEADTVIDLYHDELEAIYRRALGLS